MMPLDIVGQSVLWKTSELEMCPEQTAAGHIALAIPVAALAKLRDLISHHPQTRNRHMTSTLCQSAALGRIIAPWLVNIAGLFGIIVKTILSMVKKVSNILHEPGACYRKAGWPWIASRGMAMLVLFGLVDAAGCVRLADLGAASARITETAGSIATSYAGGKVIGSEASGGSL
jgi:hypothetical protein